MRAEAFRNIDGLRDYWLRPDLEQHRAPRPRWIVILAFFLLGFLCGAASVSAAEPPCVRLHVRPPTMLQRNDIDVQTRVCRDDRHRTLRIVWDADPRGWSGSSQTGLSGASAPVAYQFWLEDYPAANYDFEALALDSEGRVVNRGTARILSTEYEP